MCEIYTSLLGGDFACRNFDKNEGARQAHLIYFTSSGPFIKLCITHAAHAEKCILPETKIADDLYSVPFAVSSQKPVVG